MRTWLLGGLVKAHEKMVVFLNKDVDSGDSIAARPFKDHEAQHGDSTALIYGAFQSLNLVCPLD